MLFGQLYLWQEETHFTNKADLAPQREEDFIGLPVNLQTVSKTNLTVKLFLFCFLQVISQIHAYVHKQNGDICVGMLYILWGWKEEIKCTVYFEIPPPNQETPSPESTLLSLFFFKPLMLLAGITYYWRKLVSIHKMQYFLNLLRQ